MDASSPPRPPERLLTFRSGGWVLLLAAVFSVLGVAWNLRSLWDPDRKPVRGDGRTVESYRFDLRTTLVPRGAIVSSGMVVDAIPSLDAPRATTPERVRLMSEVEKGKYVVPGDKVIGVEVNGEARCYPLRVLNWHEIVNDTLGGVPIAVTYNPLSAGIAVFDRRVGDETLTFGVSGLLLASNLLMYDRRPDAAGESLWSQLQARAVTGPAAAARRTLTLVPSALSRYDAWIARYPGTSVLAPVEGETDRYPRDVYGTYFASETLKYPVDPMPPADSLPPKTRVVVEGAPGARRVTVLRVSEGESRPDAVVGPDGGRIVNGIYAYWAAWYALHPDDPGNVER